MSIDHAARTAVNATLDNIARRYLEASPERRRDFLRRLSTDFDAMTDDAQILARLEHIAKKQRERAGHWTYSMHRLMAAEGYARAVRAEINARQAA